MLYIQIHMSGRTQNSRPGASSQSAVGEWSGHCAEVWPKQTSKEGGPCASEEGVSDPAAQGPTPHPEGKRLSQCGPPHFLQPRELKHLRA